MTQIVMLRDSGNDDVEMTATNNEGDDDDDDQHGKTTMAMEGANDHDDGDHDTANGSMQ